jgi:hypothetical protein
MTYLSNFFNLIICIPIFNIINLLKIPYSKYIKPIQIRRFIISKKRDLIITFKKARSRHNSFSKYTDEPEKWMLYFTTEKRLIHGKNCSLCGNYIRDGILYKNYSEKILCKCHHNNMINYDDDNGYNFYCDLEDDI